ncbi:fatty-acyl-CoA synthase [Xenorhabdus cabanillasii]|uniref:Fatty-acyl-CoA synthase n=1 Tax=Xenorhabdus cabanillasii TaxID=351673 RepID=A0A3D9UJL2_9GAMM|nr:long-chain-fatty-acid--CoA ligase [Xenorhabdus cabanillasii]REF28603.1 fatty-acyl-CoA synthase [Xenorhabdus cabanillasii]
MSINNLFNNSVKRHENSIIVYKDITRYTYSQLRDRVKNLSSSLVKMGVKKGDVVAIADWDSNRYLEMYFAVPMIGATLMTCNIRLSKDQKIYTLNHCEAKHLFVNSDFEEEIKNDKGMLPIVLNYIICDDNNPHDDQYESLITSEDKDFSFPDIDEDSVATLFYTSGTTGLPKGFFFTHRQLVLHTLALSCSLGSNKCGQRLHNEDVYLPLTPMFHVHAWGLPYVATMMGLKQVYTGKYCAKSICKLIAAEGVTFTHSVPTLLCMVLDEAELEHVDLSNLKVLVGGASLNPPLLNRALSHGIDVWSGYGMSETGPVIAVNKMKQGILPDFRCHAGEPIPFVNIEIDSDTDLNDEQQLVGEITVVAPWLTPNYFKDNDNTKKLWKNGRLHTGDIGYIHENGSLVITDRKKDLIKSGGEWLSPNELENRALDIESIREAAFIAWPNERWGERPIAFVVPQDSTPHDEIKNRVNKHFIELTEQGKISKFAIPDLIVIVDKLPKTSVGKTDKKNLIKQLEKEMNDEY